LDPLTDEKIALVDSGVYNPLIIKCRAHRINLLEANQTPDKEHGTFVASRILFGSNIFKPVSTGASLRPAVRFIDVQVLYKDGNGSHVNPEVLKEAILQVVTRHTDVAIFNLSLAEFNPIKEGEVSEITEFLDHISNKYDVIFVCSVGNHDIYDAYPYREIFRRPEAWIAAPADAINVISVGAISSTVSMDTLCPDAECPSPFTRVGGMRNGLKKPELVGDGGNIKKSSTGIYDQAHMEASGNLFGVEGINQTGLGKNIGTSQSAPLITRECALLLDYLKKTNFSDYISLKNNRANLVKALLIHSTTRVNQVIPKEDSQKYARGFGIASYSSVLRDNDDQITLVYADGISFVEKKHKIRINLPAYLLGKEVEATLTVVYNPPVDKNYPKDYKMVHLDASLRSLFPAFGAQGEALEKDKPVSLTPAHSWQNYRHESHSVIHYKKHLKKLNSQVLEVLLQLSATRPFENKIIGKDEDRLQNYALLLTLTDKSQSRRCRQEIMALNEFETIVENEVAIEAEN
jgi:hypothetical protein